MADRTFNIDGRDVPYYYLSNKEMLDLYKSESTSEDDKEFIKDKIVSAFEYNLVPKQGENEDDVFARFISNYVNKCPNDFKKAAKRMAQDHRYLQQEMFKLFIEYAKILAENAKNGIYDGRNEWACKTSEKIIEAVNTY